MGVRYVITLAVLRKIVDTIYQMTGYSYTISLSGLFELYMIARGRHLNHKVKLSGLKCASSVQFKQGYSISGLYLIWQARPFSLPSCEGEG